MSTPATATAGRTPERRRVGRGLPIADWDRIVATGSPDEPAAYAPKTTSDDRSKLSNRRLRAIGPR